MSYDPDDAIAAIASSAGASARGIVRLSGPRTVECLTACFEPEKSCDWPPRSSAAQRLAGVLRVDADGHAPPLGAPGALFLWPGVQSYTRQPSAEFHTLGSPPLLSAVLGQLCRCGARPAQPGEFTLRAFLAGRIDLTQAEAVLGVVEARHADDLAGALDQLAGGLSRPLDRLRERLLALLAELEAGLDFSEEPIQFVSRAELRRQLAASRGVVAATQAQIQSRDRRGELPRVVLAGLSNVGKSRLFNALVDRYGLGRSVPAIVSSTSGSTRDYLTAALDLDGVGCKLVDVAGEDVARSEGLDKVAQQRAAVEHDAADVRLRCIEALPALADGEVLALAVREDEIIVLTKSDLAGAAAARRLPANVVACSGATGEGVYELAVQLRQRLARHAKETRGALFAAATAARAAGSLDEADRALQAAWELAEGGGDELVAAELRAALGALGEVVGQVCADDVLDKIFAKFCIGK